MDVKEAKRKKRNQVLQMFIAAVVFDLWSYYIVKNAPEGISLIRYLFSPIGYGWPISSHSIIIIIGCFTTLLFLWELKEYLQGNYKLWKPAK